MIMFTGDSNIYLTEKFCKKIQTYEIKKFCHDNKYDQRLRLSVGDFKVLI